MQPVGRQLNWSLDPLSALAHWPTDRPVVLLHSGRHHPSWARWSILASPTASLRFTGTPATGGQTRWIGPDVLGLAGRLSHNPFADIRLAMQHADNEAAWIGYLSYDLGRWVESLPESTINDRDWPIFELGYCPGRLVYDNLTQTWYAQGQWDKQTLPDLPRLPQQTAHWQARNLTSGFSPDQYQKTVARVINYIHAGDAFQVNLTQRFSAELDTPWPAGSRSLFSRLATVSPAWYGAYLELADQATPDRRALASTSPELFVQVDANGHIVTRPIKGTAPASVPAAKLLHSEKDAAELHMIVDLLRNDLGRVCQYGSVQVPEPRVIESHPTVHHGVATITGRLRPECDVADLLQAAMPGGSITGAPKVRAMQIIEELEPVRRGPYCGCIGMLSRSWTCLNIAIRTLMLQCHAHNPKAGRVDFGVGGGIVADSQPQAEYQETLDKAAALLKTLQITRP